MCFLKNDNKSNISDELRKLIKFHHIEGEKFIPGKTKIRLACRSYDESDVIEAIEAFLNWPTIGKKVEECEEKLATLLGIKNAVTPQTIRLMHLEVKTH